MSTGTVSSPFKRRTTTEGGGDFELPAGGTYPSVLVGLIDMGTQNITFNNETKKQRKILLVWELTGEHNSKGEPFFVSKDFTYSLNAKANLRKFLEGWDGRKFGDDEEIDLTRFVNANCVLNVTEGTSTGGKKFVDVASATKPMKGLTVPPRSVEPFVWSVEEAVSGVDDPGIPEWVPMLYGRKVVDDIKKSDEWGNLPGF